MISEHNSLSETGKKTRPKGERKDSVSATNELCPRINHFQIPVISSDAPSNANHFTLLGRTHEFVDHCTCCIIAKIDPIE